jgi:hypothetical protein
MACGTSRAAQELDLTGVALAEPLYRDAAWKLQKNPASQSK